MKTFIVLGSGATADGFKIEIGNKKFDPPMDWNFFDTPIVHKLYNQEKFPALHYFQNSQFQFIVSLEKTWSNIDLSLKLTNNNNAIRLRVISMTHDYRKLEEFLNRKKENKDNENYKNNLNCQLDWVDEGGSIAPLASWEAVELISNIYKNLECQGNPALSKIIDEILENSCLKGIATFNYDNSVEKIWKNSDHKEKLYYYDPNHSSGYINGIPLYKLHGSLNWTSIFKGDTGWSYIIPSDIDSKSILQKYIQGSFTNRRPDICEEPNIIAPDVFKQNITLDIQNDLKSILFKKIWNRVWEELKDVDILIFIGFSFPDTDHHAKLLFGEANRRQPFSKVIVNKKSDKNLLRYHSIFGRSIVNFIPGGVQNMVQKKDELVSLLISLK